MKNIDNSVHILNIHKKVNFLPTLTANQYDYYKEDLMPVSKTLMNRSGKTWNELLASAGLKEPLSRKTLAKLSYALHMLEKKIKNALEIGWDEKNFKLNGKNFRPDSCFTERMMINDGRFFVLDVKLCISATTIAVYKYLPLFENIEITEPQSHQTTFFEEWLPDKAIERPFLHYDQDGQSSMALKNNVLYIAYLIGKPQSDVIPCSTIRGKYTTKKKKIPENMEIRYVDFMELPRLYCDLASIEYDIEKITPLLQCAEKIKSVVMDQPDNVESLSIELYEKIKTQC